MKKQQTIEKAREMGHDKVVRRSDALDSDEDLRSANRLSQLHSDWMSNPACRFVDSRRQRETSLGGNPRPQNAETKGITDSQNSSHCKSPCILSA